MLGISEVKIAGRTALVGVAIGVSAEEAENSLDELERLVDTAGGETVVRLIQQKDAPDVRTLIGSGKIKELAWLCMSNAVELVVFDAELSPSQIRNIEEALGNVSVIDRSMLILDIFALHATSGEGKLQVELAQLKYTSPRLIGKGSEMSRLGGGIGTRGPGESKLETDRRHLNRRIAALEEALREIDKNRTTMRASRDKSGVIKVAVVGYTNAGKSTIMNRLTDADVLSEDKLFATLDATTRKCELPSGETILLTDTVGFIKKLPHHLVKAFKSTLDEVVYSDVIMIVIDASDPDYKSQLAVTEEILSDLGASGKPTLYVFNKCDKGVAEPRGLGAAPQRENTVYISALTGQGEDILLSRIEELIHLGKERLTFVIPNNEQWIVNSLYKNASVENVEYGNDHVEVTAVVDPKLRGQLKAYVRKD